MCQLFACVSLPLPPPMFLFLSLSLLMSLSLSLSESICLCFDFLLHSRCSVRLNTSIPGSVDPTLTTLVTRIIRMIRHWRDMFIYITELIRVRLVTMLRPWHWCARLHNNYLSDWNQHQGREQKDQKRESLQGQECLILHRWLLHPSTATWEAVNLVLALATPLAQIYDIESLRENDENIKRKRKQAGGGTLLCKV